jgi:hypothetical protein
MQIDHDKYGDLEPASIEHPGAAGAVPRNLQRDRGLGYATSGVMVNTAA